MAHINNNEELIIDLMNFSPYGALCQAFIMQGLQEYCKQVIEDKEELLEDEKKLETEGKRPIVSTQAWIGIAEDITKRMDAFYEPNKKSS
jgi:hypothetical protein